MLSLCIMWQNIKWLFLQCIEELRSCYAISKPFVQSHLLVRLLICCCLRTNDLLILCNVCDIYKSLMTAH